MVWKHNKYIPVKQTEEGIWEHTRQDLIAKHNKRWTWKSVLVTAGVVILVIALIVVGSVMLSSGPEKGAEDGEYDALKSTPRPSTIPTVTLEDFVAGKMSATKFNGSWISGNEITFRGESGNVLVYNVDTKSHEVVAESHIMAMTAAFKHDISADRKFLLLAHDYQKLFRHSFLAEYDIYDLNMELLTPLMAEDSGRNMQLVVWSPTDNGLAYVYKNNIYYKPSADGSSQYAVTDTGVVSAIYNGVPDWVYEEEVLSSNQAMWFSPDGRKLAYATFNDTEVKQVAVPIYGVPGSLEYQYSKSINIRYPKPGTPNPLVSLHIVDLKNLTKEHKLTITIPAPIQVVTRDHILTSVAWANDVELVAIWMNRVQNVAVVARCNANNGNCGTVLEIKEEYGWVDLFVPPLFSSDGSKMALILPHRQGEDGDYRHVTLADNMGSTPTALTSGKFVVTELLTWDTTNNKIYFSATEENAPNKQHIYRISSSVEGAPHKPECLSCAVKTAGGHKNCTYNRAEFSNDSSNFILLCNGPDVPQVSIHNQDGKELIVWENNENVRDYLHGKAKPTSKMLEVDVPGGFKALVKIWLPSEFDDSGKTKYPLLVNVYGGPDSFQVTDKFVGDWSIYLTTNKSVIYASIDGRGSGLKGNKMLYAGYRRLGTVEIEDQINVTRYLQNKFKFIDKKRSAIWGWSYGGYSTAMALAKDTDGVFKCGISVAPVTDWIYYDTIYTERYMGLPTKIDNMEGYKTAEVNTKVENLRNKMFLLIHGTEDDNVHYQQSMMLSRVLEVKDILFRQQSYPDEEHGLAGVRPHLYHSLEEFLGECYNWL